MIAYLGLTSYHGIAIHEIDYTDYRVLVQYVDSTEFDSTEFEGAKSTKRWCALHETSRGVYFTSRGTRYYLGEFIRV